MKDEPIEKILADAGYEVAVGKDAVLQMIREKGSAEVCTVLRCGKVITKENRSPIVGVCDTCYDRFHDELDTKK